MAITDHLYVAAAKNAWGRGVITGYIELNVNANISFSIIFNIKR